MFQILTLSVTIITMENGKLCKNLVCAEKGTINCRQNNKNGFKDERKEMRPNQ
jgi:hypothetical protein